MYECTFNCDWLANAFIEFDVSLTTSLTNLQKTEKRNFSKHVKKEPQNSLDTQKQQG